MYREISDLGLFVRTSPYGSGLGLYQKEQSVRHFSIQTSRSINYKKLMCFCNFSRINVSWRLEVDQRSNPSVLVGRFVRFLCSRRIGSFFIQLRIILMNIFLYVDHECTLISSRLIIDTNIWMTKLTILPLFGQPRQLMYCKHTIK